MPESTEFFAQPFLAGSSGDPSSTLELETLTVGAPQAQAGLAQAPDPSLSPQSAIHLEREYLKENRASIHGPSLSGRIHGLGGVVGEVSVETGKVGKAPLYHFAAFNNMLYEFEERAKGQNKVSESWGPKSGAQSCGIWGSGRGARTPVHDGQTPAYGESRIQQVVGCPNGTKGASVYSGNMGNGAWLNGFPVCTSMVGSDGGIIVMPVAKDGGDNVWGPEGGGETGKVWRGPSSPLHFAGQTLSAQPTVTAKVTGGEPPSLCGSSPRLPGSPAAGWCQSAQGAVGPRALCGCSPDPPRVWHGGWKTPVPPHCCTNPCCFTCRTFLLLQF